MAVLYDENMVKWNGYLKFKNFFKKVLTSVFENGIFLLAERQ